jgi:putative permease
VPRESLVRRALPTYVALLFAILTICALLVLVELRHVLFLLFVSVLFAAALSGPTARLERLRVPRAVAAVSIYVAAFALVVAAAWLVVPPLFEQVSSFASEAPEYAERYESLRARYEDLRDDYPGLAPFDDQVARIGNAIGESAGERALALPSALFGALLDLLAIFVISLLLVTNRERLLALVLSLLHPSDHDRVASLVEKMWTRIGFYLRAKVIVMAIVGAITYVALLVIGVPFALMLAIVVAFGEVIPRVGPWLARIPLLGIAALEGLVTLGLTFLASVVIENLKGFVISPVVEGKQLDIHPLLVFVAVLAGGALGGFAGAFVAVPLAAIVEILFEDVVLPRRRGRLTAEPPPPRPA